MVNLKIVCEQRDCGADKLTANKGRGRNSRTGKGDCGADERTANKGKRRKETAKLMSVSE